MILYVYDQYRGNKTVSLNTDQLITLALNQYISETGLGRLREQRSFQICRTQKGKPYVENFPAHFSVSHSDQLWICLIGNEESGVDIQNISHTNYEAISNRFFQKEEQKAVHNGGVETFMSIWCRKEAFIKFYGMTIGETIDWLNVAARGTPADKLEYLGKTIFFSELEVHPEFFCVAATSTKEAIWIRTIQVD
jgi:4'-phosphopantetheinyl transferase